MKDLKSVVEQYLDAIIRHDFGKIRQMVHQQYSYTAGNGQRQEGPSASVAVAEMYTSAFPDMKLDIKQMYSAGDIVVTEFIASGTHRGELMGIEPTNHKASIPVCNVTEFRDGLIYAEHQYFDALFLMQQLGVEMGHEHA